MTAIRTRDDVNRLANWMAQQGAPEPEIKRVVAEQMGKILSGTGSPAPMTEPPPGLGGPHPGAPLPAPEGVGMGPAAQLGAVRGGAALAGTPGMLAGLPVMGAGALQGGLANLAGDYETADAGFRAMEKAWNMPGGMPWMQKQAEQAGLTPDIRSEDMTMGEKALANSLEIGIGNLPATGLAVAKAPGMLAKGGRALWDAGASALAGTTGAGFEQMAESGKMPPEAAFLGQMLSEGGILLSADALANMGGQIRNYFSSIPTDEKEARDALVKMVAAYGTDMDAGDLRKNLEEAKRLYKETGVNTVMEGTANPGFLGLRDALANQSGDFASRQQATRAQVHRDLNDYLTSNLQGRAPGPEGSRARVAQGARGELSQGARQTVEAEQQALDLQADQARARVAQGQDLSDQAARMREKATQDATQRREQIRQKVSEGKLSNEQAAQAEARSAQIMREDAEAAVQAEMRADVRGRGLRTAVADQKAADQTVIDDLLAKAQESGAYGQEIDVTEINEVGERILADERYGWEGVPYQPQAARVAARTGLPEEADLAELADMVPAPGQLSPTPTEGPPTASLQQLIDLRMRINDDLRSLPTSIEQSGVTEKARRLREINKVVQKTIDDFRASPEGEAYGEFANAYATFAETYKRGPTAEVLEGFAPGKVNDLKVPNSNVAQRFVLADGQTGAIETAQEFRRKFGDNPAAVKALEDQVMEEAASDPVAWANNHQQFLDVYPEMRPKLDTVRQAREAQAAAPWKATRKAADRETVAQGGQERIQVAEEQAAGRRQARKLSQEAKQAIETARQDLAAVNNRVRELGSSTLTRVAKADPELLAKPLLSSDNPPEAIRDTLRRIERYGGRDLQAQVKDVLLDEILRDTRNTKDGLVDPAALSSMLEGKGRNGAAYRSAIMSVYGEEGLAVMRNMRDQLRHLEATLPTTEKIDFSRNSNWRNFQGSGLSMPMILSRLYGIERGVVGPRWVASDFIARLIGGKNFQEAEKRAKELLDRAWRDPKVAEILLDRTTDPKKIQRKWEKLRRILKVGGEAVSRAPGVMSTLADGED